MLTQEEVEQALHLLHKDADVPMVTLPPPLQELTPDDWLLLQAMLWQLLQEREESLLQ
jgi:hypothetical protein